MECSVTEPILLEGLHFLFFTQIKPQKPPKFSWVIPGLLAAHGRPTKPGHLEYLIQNGIKILITLTENKPRAMHEYKGMIAG